MKDVECPYCGKDLEIDTDGDYGTEEDVTYEQECEHCENTFVYTVSITVHYSTKQAPCKNGGEHAWKPMCGAPREYFEGRERCTVCDEERLKNP